MNVRVRRRKIPGWRDDLPTDARACFTDERRYSFVARAKEEIVEAERAKLAAAEQEKTALEAAIARIESIGAA